MESAPSRTAMFAAVSRGLFRLETASPWVLDDALALVLVGRVWKQLRDKYDPLFPGPLLRESRAAVCTRSRYAEDRLAAGAFTQYVILGAGLDSFAWRRPDLLGSLTVFEVDHPASQAWKLERAGELGLPLSDSQVFVPADFEAGPVQGVLSTTGFDWAQPTLFCWTGVAPYLTEEAIESALRTIAAAAAGRLSEGGHGLGSAATRIWDAPSPSLTSRRWCRARSGTSAGGEQAAGRHRRVLDFCCLRSRSVRDSGELNRLMRSTGPLRKI
jgi:methyltransferase (TIGR00027 family)